MTSPDSFGCSKSPSSSIICEEVFDEGYQPSNEEIRDYAIRIGIDPEKEPFLLYIAKDGLMQALPPNWQICYNDKYQAYYYANRESKVTQWEHPLDVEFKKVVEKARKSSLNLIDDKSTIDDPSLIDSGIKSLQEKEEGDANSMDNNFGGRFLSPINGGGSGPSGNIRKNGGTSSQIGLTIKSDEHLSPQNGRNMTTFGQMKEDANKPKGFTLTGTGSMFLKSNTAKTIIASPLQQFKESFGSSERESSLTGGVKGILRDSSLSDVRTKNNSSLTNPDNGSFDLEDRTKSVRFNFENKDEMDVKSLESLEKSSEESKSSIDDEDEDVEEANPEEEEESEDIKWNQINQPISKPEENYVTSIRVGVNPLKPLSQSKPIIKPLTTFGKPELTGGDNELKLSNVKPLYDDESLTESEDSVKPNTNPQIVVLETHKFEEDQIRVEMEKQLEKLKSDYSEKSKLEYEKFLTDEKGKMVKLKNEAKEKFIKMKQQMDENYENDRKKYENDLKEGIKEINDSNHKMMDKLKLDLHEKNRLELDTLKGNLQAEFDEKRGTILNEHRKLVEILQKNHNEILEELERDLKTEEELLKKDHQMNLAQMKDKLIHEIEIERQRMRETGEDRLYEKIRCEKRLLEDKYRCLKEKYIRLKTDVKLSLERRNNRRKEQQQTSITTGSETERSNSNHLNNRITQQPVSAPLDYGRPPLTPKLLPQSKLAQQHNNQINQLPLPPPPTTSTAQPKEPLKKFGSSTTKYLKQIHNYNDDTTSISQSDTTVSNQYPKMHRYITGGPIGDNGNSDSEVLKVARNFYNNNNNNNTINNNNMKETPGRQRKKIFTRMKSASTSRLNSNSNNKRDQMIERPCTPVENLRRQLQKLEDLEDQFPDNSLDTTYHLRYPFTDIVNNSHKGSSELEFFKHRIHLERDSVRRAKESLRTQRTNFRARQREIKQRHKSSARHTIDQLIQEEKELTEMEVNLHRTRALLGEKVIRLRHLEQSLQRIYEKEKPDFIGDEHRGPKDDTTLSDLSSHSSSGFSSTDFATDTNQMNNTNRHKENIYQESSEIIQSLENLNAEIREIWEILSKQQSHGLTPPPSIFYPEMASWGLTSITQSQPITTSILHTNAQSHQQQQPTVIPTLADRLETYRQLATGRATTTVAGIMTTPNAANTIVSQSLAGHYTTSLVERTRDLRNWLRQAKNEHEMLSGSQQADL